jgi:hypothetical protein
MDDKEPSVSWRDLYTRLSSLEESLREKTRFYRSVDQRLSHGSESGRPTLVARPSHPA